MMLMLIKFRPLLLLTAAVSLGLGISLPLMQFEKLWFFSETPSLLHIIGTLWSDGEWGLALVVLVFSIIFPLLKLGAVFQTMVHKTELSGWTASLAKWSMMDVMLVAIVIFAAKTSGLANAFTQPGVWFYAVSSITASIASINLGK